MPKVKIDLNNPTGNFWIDNGIVVLYDLFGKGEFRAEEICDGLIRELVVETGNIGEYYDAASGEIKNYRKKNWVYPANFFIKPSPRADKIKINGKNYFLSPPQFNLQLKFSKKKAICDICGKINYLTDAKMWMFPFTVELSRFSNFYSGLKKGIKLCPRCALAGLAGYLGWLWKAQGKDKLHVFIFYSDLQTMHRLRTNVFKYLEHTESSKGGNVPLEFGGSYTHETTLGLLLRLFRELKSRKSSLPEEGEKLLKEILEESIEEKPLTLLAFSGTPAKAFNMDSIAEFSELKTLYRLYVKWADIFSRIEGNPHQIIVNVFRQFVKKEGKNLNSIWRDKIVWAILKLEDPSVFIEDFLFGAKSPLEFGTLDIFELYWKEVIGMDEKLLNVLRSFGHNLGQVACEKEEMGLLYTLRNAKNPDDFYKVLNDIQFRLGLTIPEDILHIEKGEKIKENPWLRVKTLLSIYSMNSYLWKKSKNKSKNEEVES